MAQDEEPDFCIIQDNRELVFNFNGENPSQIKIDWETETPTVIRLGIIGDLDMDGDVDGKDLSIFTQAFGEME